MTWPTMKHPTAPLAARQATMRALRKAAGQIAADCAICGTSIEPGDPRRQFGPAAICADCTTEAIATAYAMELAL